MIRPNARSVHAQVIERKSRLDGSDKQLVTIPVSPLFYPDAVDLHIEQAVSVRVHRAGPFPARIRHRYLVNESLRGITEVGTKCHTTHYTEFIGRQLIDSLVPA